MKRLVLILAVAVLYLLHQDVWFWRTAEPMVLGFLPVGMAYHALYTIAVSAFMWCLVSWEWPGHLEELAEHPEEEAGRH